MDEIVEADQVEILDALDHMLGTHAEFPHLMRALRIAYDVIADMHEDDLDAHATYVASLGLWPVDEDPASD